MVDLKKSISQVTTQLQPILDAFLKQLGIKTEREQKRTLQRAQVEGRVTTGFLPEMRREVREESGMQESLFRGEHAQTISNLAMQLFGIESEGERQQKQIRSAEKMAELNRKLTREGWGFQARQAEIDRQLTREGWDRQSKESILQRTFQAGESELDRALERELAKMRGAGAEGGITFDLGGLGGGKIDSFRDPQPLSDIFGDWSGRRKKPVYKAGRQFETVKEAQAYRPKSYQPTQKTTTYRGTRLGRI